MPRLRDILVRREITVESGKVIGLGAGEAGHAKEAVNVLGDALEGFVDLILFREIAEDIPRQAP